MRSTDGRSLITLVVVLVVILAFAIGGYLLIGGRTTVTPASSGDTLASQRQS